MTSFILGKNSRQEDKQYVSVSAMKSGSVSVRVSCYGDDAIIFLSPEDAMKLAKVLVMHAKDAAEETTNA